jgi:ribonuclease D
MSEPRDIIGTGQPEHCDLPSGWIMPAKPILQLFRPTPQAIAEMQRLGIQPGLTETTRIDGLRTQLAELRAQLEELRALLGREGTDQ